MKTLTGLSILVISLVLTACSATIKIEGLGKQEGSTITQKIKFGTSPLAEEHPYVGAIYYPFNSEGYIDPKGEYVAICTGTLIAPKTVLTAAHCVSLFHWLKLPPKYMRFSLNNTRPTDFNEQSTRVNNYQIHLSYKEWGFGPSVDLAVIRLENPIELDEYPEILSDPVPEGSKVSIVGYGLDALAEPRSGNQSPIVIAPDANGNSGTKLHQEVTFTGYEELVSLSLSGAPNTITNGLATIWTNVHESITCRGDSGSPLIYNGKIAGVLSGGHSADSTFSCLSSISSLYVSMAPRAHRGWIKKAQNRLARIFTDHFNDSSLSDKWSEHPNTVLTEGVLTAKQDKGLKIFLKDYVHRDVGVMAIVDLKEGDSVGLLARYRKGVDHDTGYMAKLTKKNGELYAGIYYKRWQSDWTLISGRRLMGAKSLGKLYFRTNGKHLRFFHEDGWEIRVWNSHITHEGSVGLMINNNSQAKVDVFRSVPMSHEIRMFLDDFNREDTDTLGKLWTQNSIIELENRRVTSKDKLLSGTAHVKGMKEISQHVSANVGVRERFESVSLHALKSSEGKIVGRIRRDDQGRSYAEILYHKNGEKPELLSQQRIRVRSGHLTLSVRDFIFVEPSDLPYLRVTLRLNDETVGVYKSHILYPQAGTAGFSVRGAVIDNFQARGIRPHIIMNEE